MEQLVSTEDARRIVFNATKERYSNQALSRPSLFNICFYHIHVVMHTQKCSNKLGNMYAIFRNKCVIRVYRDGFTVLQSSLHWTAS